MITKKKTTNERMEEYARAHSKEIDGALWEYATLRDLSHLALLGVTHQLAEAKRREFQQRVKEYEMFEDLRKAREGSRGFWSRVFCP